MAFGLHRRLGKSIERMNETKITASAVQVSREEAKVARWMAEARREVMVWGVKKIQADSATAD